MASRIKRTLKLLDKGPDVAALQRALAAAGLSIADEERKGTRFGLSTRDALRRFQAQSNLQTTGIVDEATTGALNRVLDAAADTRPQLEPSHRPFRKLPSLAQSLGTFRAADDRVNGVVQTSSIAVLKRRLVEQFEVPSERLVAAINALGIDLDEVEDMTAHDLVFSRLLPELATDPELNRELMRHADRGFDADHIKVSDILGLDADARESTILAPLVNRARNEALADIVGLPARAIDALGTMNLLADSEALDRLTADGTLTTRQRGDLLSAAVFARLTDDNFTATRALRSAGVRTARDLADRDHAQWVAFITEHDIEPSAGESVDSYADLLEAGVERAVPTAYALHRFAVEAPRETLDRLSVLDRVGADVDRIFDNGELSPDLDLDDLPDVERESLRAGLDELNRFANRYAALGVRDILNDRSITRTEQRARIVRRAAALSRGWETRPDLDLRVANFLPLADPVSQRFTVNLEDVPEEDRGFVRAALMSVQRVHQLTDGWAEADRLLSAGLDTAARITAFADADQLAQRTGLSLGAALRIRKKALDIQSRVTHVVHAIEGIASHSAFDPVVMKEADAGPDLGLINVLRRLPGYADLFGNQNYCKCRHCQSILSPAAYFVDLMSFIDKTISRPNFVTKDRIDHPLYLRNRRGDLWHLPLTAKTPIHR